MTSAPECEHTQHCAVGELSAAGADYGAADLLECRSECAGGWVCVGAADECAQYGADHALIRPGTNPAAIAVNRNQIQIKSVEGDLWDQTEVTARFKALGLRNRLCRRRGGRAGDFESDQDQLHDQQDQYCAFDEPAESECGGARLAGRGIITSIVHTKSKSVGIYFVDTVKLGRYFEVSGGVRWDCFDTGFNSYSPTPPAGGSGVTADDSADQPDGGAA